MPSSLRPHGLYSPWNSPGQNTGVGSLSLLQEIFLTQGSNWGLLQFRQILYQLSYEGAPEEGNLDLTDNLKGSLCEECLLCGLILITHTHYIGSYSKTSTHDHDLDYVTIGKGGKEEISSGYEGVKDYSCTRLQKVYQIRRHIRKDKCKRPLSLSNFLLINVKDIN